MESIWRATTTIEERKPLQAERNVHTVVIGAGMTGILTAYQLQRKGQEVIIVEAKEIASGQTGSTTAKLTSQHGMIYHKLIQRVGRERAKTYALANEEAIRIYEQMIRDEQIDCDFQTKPAYLYTLHPCKREKLKREAAAAASLGIKARYLEGDEITELPFQVQGAVCFERQAQFHPLKLLKHLAGKLEIYENTKVLAVRGHVVYTNRGKIKARHIVFATHYPITNIPGFYFLRQHQERSYVLALEGQKELSGMYYGIDEGGLSLRSVGNILLLGGGGHRTGKDEKKHRKGDNKVGYSYLRRMAQIYYKEASEKYVWAAQDCMSHDGIPFIGRYSVIRPYWYVATGFKKWGMTFAMLAAITISNQICGVYDPYKKLVCPQRFYTRASLRNLLVDIGESIKGLGKGVFSKSKRRCPHMGCRLEWNRQEKSWDCPCHGSRFDQRGELLDNPAQMDLV
ncbi:MAG: FAD-dependent oxidoreductase [Lachnospiraceae bacterium]|nr:FAD-dependent oxidoreductase [Lachnospiraceae bacterium]